MYVLSDGHWYWHSENAYNWLQRACCQHSASTLFAVLELIEPDETNQSDALLAEADRAIGALHYGYTAFRAGYGALWKVKLAAMFRFSYGTAIHFVHSERVDASPKRLEQPLMGYGPSLGIMHKMQPHLDYLSAAWEVPTTGSKWLSPANELLTVLHCLRGFLRGTPKGSKLVDPKLSINIEDEMEDLFEEYGAFDKVQEKAENMVQIMKAWSRTLGSRAVGVSAYDNFSGPERVYLEKAVDIAEGLIERGRHITEFDVSKMRKALAKLGPDPPAVCQRWLRQIVEVRDTVRSWDYLGEKDYLFCPTWLFRQVIKPMNSPPTPPFKPIVTQGFLLPNRGGADHTH